MSAPVPNYVRKATFSRGYDGDSFFLVLDHGRYPVTRSLDEIEVRVKDLWCPELRDPGGAEAAAFTTSLVQAAKSIICQSYKGSFARTVCDVWVDDMLVRDLVIDARHGFASPQARDRAVAQAMEDRP